MLSNAAVKAARPRARPYKIYDDRGLSLHVAPTGTKSFRLRFRFAGAEQVLTIGQWPDLSLQDARDRADAARAQLGRGEDPRAAAVVRVRTFEAAARAWIKHACAGWSAVHAGDVLASLEADVFPAIGATELGAVDTPAVVEALRAVEARGAIETARRLRQRISAVYELAMSEGWCAANPAAVTRRALAAAPARQQHPALTDPAEARALLAAAELVDAGDAAKLASRFLALTAVRWDAVRGARWGEIEDLDGDAPLWRVPAARVKLRAAKKQDAANDHLVPLSAAAVAVLRAARSIPGQMCKGAETGDISASDLIFTGRGSNKPLGERAILDLYARTPFAGRHVPHGWRASFSTILNEAMPEDRAAIDRALGHALKDEDGKVAKVEGAYNRAQLLPARRRLFDAWAAILAG